MHDLAKEYRDRFLLSPKQAREALWFEIPYTVNDLNHFIKHEFGYKGDELSEVICLQIIKRNGDYLFVPDPDPAHGIIVITVTYTKEETNA